MRIYCFGCNNIRDLKGSVERNWGFGPRYFCAKCAARPFVRDMPLVSDVVPRPASEPKPGSYVRPDNPKPSVTSMAAWVRERRDWELGQLCKELVATFPDSKPGKNPKLAKSYVSCYLKK